MAPILLIHGLFGSLSAPGILSAFEDAPVVLAPDLLGYGQFRPSGPQEWTLFDQADHLAGCLRRSLGSSEPVHVVGHSVGGAVAVLLAQRYPDAVASLTSVEGNMTLRDAFWSQKIATRELSEIEEEVAGFRANVAAWIARSGVPPTEFALSTAAQWLDNQPAFTLRTQARAVVAATSAPAYLDSVRELLARGMPFHLLAGARSRGGWSVPDWLSAAAASDTVVPDTGHLLMLESPRLFAQAITSRLV